MSVLMSLAVLAMTQQSVIDKGAEWIGKSAKSVVLNDEDGKPVDVSKQFGKVPVVLVFYRAIW